MEFSLNLCNLGPLASRQVVVIHDASTKATPQAFSRLFRWVYGLLIPAVAARATRLVTVSEFSRSEISRWFGIPQSRFSVCLEGAEHILSTAADENVLQRHGITKGQYFLGVGMGPANKNQATILNAFEEAAFEDVKLVFTGRRYARVHGNKALVAPPGVVHVGHVSDQELRALYEGAIALVFPSSYEGFGLPPMEAMACGCPVLMSNQPALLETAGKAALTVDAGDTSGFARALRRLTTDPGLRMQLAEQGLERARRFTWRATAEILLAQCEAVAA